MLGIERTSLASQYSFFAMGDLMFAECTVKYREAFAKRVEEEKEFADAHCGVFRDGSMEADLTRLSKSTVPVPGQTVFYCGPEDQERFTKATRITFGDSVVSTIQEDGGVHCTALSDEALRAVAREMLEALKDVDQSDGQALGLVSAAIAKAKEAGL